MSPGQGSVETVEDEVVVVGQLTHWTPSSASVGELKVGFTAEPLIGTFRHSSHMLPLTELSKASANPVTKVSNGCHSRRVATDRNGGPEVVS